MHSLGAHSPKISDWHDSHPQRAFELGIIAATSPCVLPATLAAAVLIRTIDGFPPIKAQKRLGQHDERFTMLKLRTMHPSTPDVMSLGDDHPNATALGRVLRKLRTDEAPQIINILNGDMHLVGPRPQLNDTQRKFREVLDDDAEFERWWELRRLAKPGIFDPFGVDLLSNNTSQDPKKTIQQRIESDLNYIQNANFELDSRVIWQGINVFRRLIREHVA